MLFRSQLSGPGYTLLIEGGSARISSMNVEEVTIKVVDLTRIELKKMDSA